MEKDGAVVNEAKCVERLRGIHSPGHNATLKNVSVHRRRVCAMI